ncbi:MAG: hypothetical protein ACRDEA_20240 [Microcystaceae cyanobacterium]
MLNRTLRLTAITSLPAILLALSIPIRPAAAFNQFDVCVTQLTDSGVSGDQAATACADALIPRELSRCVLTIQEGTPIEAEKALDACYQVRRPVDLANCVVDIQAQVLTASVTPVATPPATTGERTNLETTPETAASTSADTATENENNPSLQALDSCRRSLLPGRYSECVTGVTRNVQDMTPIQAMATCLDAEDFPRDLFPAYTEN